MGHVSGDRLHEETSVGASPLKECLCAFLTVKPGFGVFIGQTVTAARLRHLLSDRLPAPAENFTVLQRMRAEASL